MSGSARALAQHIEAKLYNALIDTEDVERLIEAYAAEQTAAEAAKHADCCVDREELAALRAALNVLRQPDATRCASERCGECAACHASALLDAPEAAP